MVREEAGEPKEGLLEDFSDGNVPQCRDGFEDASRESWRDARKGPEEEVDEEGRILWVPDGSVGALWARGSGRGSIL